MISKGGSETGARSQGKPVLFTPYKHFFKTKEHIPLQLKKITDKEKSFMLKVPSNPRNAH